MFPIELDLPEPAQNVLAAAQKAIRREYRESAKWKRLRCRNVRLVSQSKSGSIYELTVGHAVEFDWTWEGATAFRPLLLTELEDSQATLFLNGSLDPDIEDSILWSGEVLEVDEAAGRIFILANNPEHPPSSGSFYVRPFEFLEFLDAVFNEAEFDSLRRLLPSRLNAACGGSHPAVRQPLDVGLSHLRTWWQKSWSVLWGPPGTGKTYTTGQQVAAVLADPSERILVISTTNKATDAVALSIGRAAMATKPPNCSLHSIRRIGKGSAIKRYEAEGLTELLKGTELEYLSQLDDLTHDLAKAQQAEARAEIRRQIKTTREAMRDAARRNFLDASVRVVVSTSFRALTFLKRDELKQSFEQGQAPFTTIFIDEAGLISRIAASALSLLASRRVVLVGDSKQLAPISRLSRILEPAQGNWLALSGVSHLDRLDPKVPGVHVLTEQRRMHAEICEVVSRYQYDGVLTTAIEVNERNFELPDSLREQPRAIWYVLDEDTNDMPSVRAERGKGNRSWVRTATARVLDKLFADPTLRTASGMFISPFKAQAKAVQEYFARNDIRTWLASTVHSQQGSEAEVVIFDSVNAGSYGWAFDEWKRLVNVAISRAREAVILLASRAEMEEPYLSPLMKFLAPRVLRKQGQKLSWETVELARSYEPMAVAESAASYLLGHQLATRKQLRPILSNEQERLCRLELDGKPRLVRGVAGSGKTVVLANWLMKTVERLSRESDYRIWAVFANRSLQSLIASSIVSAWDSATHGRSFPWGRVELRHIREILDVMLPEVGLAASEFGFDYDRAAQAFLQRKADSEIAPRCDALFIDEAQDMGPNALKLLTAIVRRTDVDDKNSRSVNIFYDNAQNIYGRGTPTWSEMGLDMRGRSSVMKESFRSTRPITEFALNVLYRLQPPDQNPDHKELVARGLIEPTSGYAGTWWQIRFNQIQGPKPNFYRFASVQQQFVAIGEYCRELIAEQGIQPSDICLLYNGRHIPAMLEEHAMPQLAGLGVQLSVQTNRPYRRDGRALLATTPHSFKGYEAEIVIVPAVEQYRAQGQGVLANTLYVAMTRARSMLTLFAHNARDAESRRLFEILDECLDQTVDAPVVETVHTPQDDFIDILEQIGEEHRKWLSDLMNSHAISQEPIITDRGEIIAEPLFTIQIAGKTHACFGNKPPSGRVMQKLEDLSIQIIQVGRVSRPV